MIDWPLYISVYLVVALFFLRANLLARTPYGTERRHWLAAMLLSVFWPSQLLDIFNSWLIKARKKCEENGNFLSQSEAPEELYPHLRRFQKLTEDWLARNIPTTFRDELLNLYFKVHGFLRISDKYDTGHVTRYKKEGKDFFLKLLCIDPSLHLQKALDKCGSVIFFSATIESASAFVSISICPPFLDHEGTCLRGQVH